MEIWISQRSKKILNYLLSEGGYCNNAGIASVLQLTPAQVRYALDRLAPWVESKGMKLIRKPRVGVKIQTTGQHGQGVFEEINCVKAKSFELSTKERRQLLCLTLLLSTNAICHTDISERLMISRPTLFRDITSIRSWCENKQLKLINRRSTGMTVTGSETCIREIIADLIISCIGMDVILSKCTDYGVSLEFIPPDATMRPDNFSAILENLFLVKTNQLVALVEKKLNVNFNDDQRIRLILCLGIVMYRVYFGRCISCDESGSNDDVSQVIARAALEIKFEMEDFIQKEIAIGDYRFIINCIVKASGFRNSDQVQDQSNVIGNKVTTDEMALMLTREAAKYLHSGLLHDQAFIDCLTWELSQSLENQSAGDSIEIMKSNRVYEKKDPLLVFTRRIFSPILDQQGWDTGEEFINAISIHLKTALARLRFNSSLRTVWLVCGSGLATARNLISRLNMHLPEVNILGVASSFEIYHNPKLYVNSDAIISTINIHIEGIHTIQVSPLLTADDISRIRKVLGLEVLEKRNRTARKPEQANILSLPEVITRETIDIDQVADSWEEVVDITGSLLLNAGAIWPSYIEAIKDIITLYGPYMVVAPGAALLHAGPEMGAKRLAVSMVVLKEPVAFGHDTLDPVNIAIAFSSVDHYSHVQTVFDIMRFIEKEENRSGLLKAASKDEILDVFKSRHDNRLK